MNTKAEKPASYIKQISCGVEYSMILKTNGDLLAYGRNESGQLGTGITIRKEFPYKVEDYVHLLSAGATHAMIVKINYTMIANRNYSVWQTRGTEERVLYFNKKNIKRSHIKDICQIEAGYDKSVFLKKDGTAWEYESNSSLPVHPKKIASNVCQISAKWFHTMLLKNDGSLWGMGENSEGELGLGTTENSLVPRVVMDNVAQVSAGYNHTMIVKTNGELWGVGRNTCGQIGAGDGGIELQPILIMDGVRHVFLPTPHNSPLVFTIIV